LMTCYEKPTELTQDQLPMTFGDISIPALRLERQMSIQASLPFVKAPSVNCFFNLGSEDCGESTEASHNSPSLQAGMESERCFDMAESTPQTYTTEVDGQSFELPPLSLTPQVSQFPQLQNMKSFSELFARQEMSVGQIFEAWNNELIQNNGEMICFTEPKQEKTNTQDSNVLGKRHFDTINVGGQFQVPEPVLKRNELSLFARKGLLSNGTEDKELFRTMLRRDNSINEECELGVDLMDFNPVFCGWTKAI